MYICVYICNFLRLLLHHFPPSLYSNPSMCLLVLLQNSCIRALADLPEDRDSIPSNHLTAHNCLYLHSQDV